MVPLGVGVVVLHLPVVVLLDVAVQDRLFLDDKDPLVLLILMTPLSVNCVSARDILSMTVGIGSTRNMLPHEMEVRNRLGLHL